jgi:hypothetical protein
MAQQQQLFIDAGAPSTPLLGGAVRRGGVEEDDDGESGGVGARSSPQHEHRRRDDDAAAAEDGGEGEAFEEAQRAHARYGSGALRAAVFGFSGTQAQSARKDGRKPSLRCKSLHLLSAYRRGARRVRADGVVSTISLLLGVHAERTAAHANTADAATDAHAHLSLVALTGVAGVLAGAASMACGEWVSMSTQAEALAGQLAVERAHLLRFPAQEAAEFAAYLRSKGVRATTAAAVVAQVAAASEGSVENALDIHAVRTRERKQRCA